MELEVLTNTVELVNTPVKLVIMVPLPVTVVDMELLIETP